MAERKPFLLRLDPATFAALQRWAADDLRSMNGEVEFLLRRALQDAGRLPGPAATPPAKRRSEPPTERPYDRPVHGSARRTHVTRRRRHGLHRGPLGGDGRRRGHPRRPAVRAVRQRGVPGRRQPVHGAVLDTAAGAGRALPQDRRPVTGHVQGDVRGLLRRRRGRDRLPLIGTKLSGDVAAARRSRPRPCPDREIHVIDTGSTSMSTGIPALIAAEMAATGASAGDIAAYVREPAPGHGPVRRRGRPGLPPQGRPAVGGAGGHRFDPVGQADHHGGRRAGRQRGAASEHAPRPVPRVIERVAAEPIERLAILHSPTSTPEEVSTFRDQLVAAICRAAWILPMSRSG